MRTVVSSLGYRKTLRRVLDAIARRGLIVFALIDHASAAREVGMVLHDEVVVLFGNPRAGTPLMQQDARIGIELPLRLLVWDGGNETIVGYNDPRDLAQFYDITSQATLEGMSSLLAEIAHDAAPDA
jgi:uncharacterized protein (DUF302 family)